MTNKLGDRGMIRTVSRFSPCTVSLDSDLRASKFGSRLGVGRVVRIVG